MGARGTLFFRGALYDHPGWLENLALAVQVQKEMNTLWPTLAAQEVEALREREKRLPWGRGAFREQYFNPFLAHRPQPVSRLS